MIKPLVINNSTVAEIINASELFGFGTLKANSSNKITVTSGTSGTFASQDLTVADFKEDKYFFVNLIIDTAELLANTYSQKLHIKLFVKGSSTLTPQSLSSALNGQSRYITASVKDTSTVTLKITYKEIGEDVEVPFTIVSANIENIIPLTSYSEIPERNIKKSLTGSIPGKWNYGSFWYIVHNVTGSDILNDLDDPTFDDFTVPLQGSTYSSISFDITLPSDPTNGLFGQENTRTEHVEFWVKSKASEIAAAIAAITGAKVETKTV